MTDIKTFFTDDELNLIYDAVSEFQDHDDFSEDCQNLLNKISSLFVEL